MASHRRHGLKRRIAVYDNGGKTFDRYTIVLLDEPERQLGMYAALALSDNPTHPQGFSQFTTATPGRHLGKKIGLRGLPTNVRQHAIARLE